MVTLLPLLIALLAPSDLPGSSVQTMDWNAQISNMSVPDPTRPNAIPALGYTGLWRTIYGEREDTDLPGDGFVSHSRLQPGIPDTDAVALRRRAPRIRTARWVAITQQFHDVPSFAIQRHGLDGPVAAFVWNHQLEQVDEIWSNDKYTMAPTMSPRDYMPNTIVESQGRTEYSNEESSGNLLLTIAVASIATILLVVIVFMPK